MVNAWSLAASILSGTFDKDYPMKKDKDKELDDSGITIENIDGVNQFMLDQVILQIHNLMMDLIMKTCT